ncbi:MAG: NADH-quinone oxidoreductase subunit N [Actinobacteria bacterium]|nr:NADH-quinone oxidoreductase subunit N [Actinomycetota bacterium]
MNLFAASTIVLPRIAYSAILPELILMGSAVVLLGISALAGRRVPLGLYTGGAVAAGAASLGASLYLWSQVTPKGAATAIDGAVAVDGFSVLVLVLVSCIVILSALIGDGYLRREGIEGAEYYVLALLSASGAMLMGVADDLILVFLGLEIMSIALYVLAGMDARRSGSREAALKYFVLGAFSSAIFLYGIALTYGATGSTNLAQIADFLSHNVVISNGVLLAGLVLLLVGFSFKIAAVPFHMWTPDVYQGSPTPVTGFMGAIAKIGGFAALLRVYFSSFGVLEADWRPIIWTLAVLTLLGGAVLALVQRDVKRMLAYSSINHAGFILVGLQAATRRGIAGSLYYLFVYAFLVVGTFAIVTVIGRRGDRCHDLSNYRGLGARQPVLALMLGILLLAQAGAPFTTGFWAKLEVVAAAAAAHSYVLAVVAMISAAIAAFFYLRLVVLMYAGSLAGLANAPQVALVETATYGPGAEASALVGSSLAGGGSAEVRPASSRLEAGSSQEAPDPDSEETRAGVCDQGEPVDQRIPVPAAIAVAVSLVVAFTVVFGIYPGPLVDFARHATLLF